MNIRKHIPNSITSMNLLCGVMGVIFALEGRLDIAFPLMILGALFDFCDGLSARLLKAYSDIGKELDSLSDMISFGVLPSVMLYKTMLSGNACNNWICYIPLVLAVFSGLRLAKFNIDERQHESFIGLPTPAAAMICGSLAYCCYVKGEDSLLFNLSNNCFFIPVLAIVLSLLLVSEIPMFAMKFGTGSKVDKKTFIERVAFLAVAVIALAAALFIGWSWASIIFIVFCSYIIINIIGAVIK